MAKIQQVVKEKNKFSKEAQFKQIRISNYKSRFTQDSPQVAHSYRHLHQLAAVQTIIFEENNLKKETQVIPCRIS